MSDAQLPELVLDLVDDVARPIGRHEKSGNALLAGLRVGDREHEREPRDLARGDELLAAVQHVAAVDLRGARANRGGIGAGVGLREREGADHAAADQIGQEALLAAAACHPSAAPRR